MSNPGGAAAQIHLDYFKNKFDNALLDAEREQSHATQVPSVPEYPDVYVNGEDHTVTVDPWKNAHWIRDDSHTWRAAASLHRGALKNHRGVVGVQHLIDQHTAPPESFVPTSGMVDRMSKFTTKCNGSSTRGRAAYARPGELPPISQLIYDDRLPRVPDWVVEREQYSGDRRRFFDDTGYTDNQVCRALDSCLLAEQGKDTWGRGKLPKMVNPRNAEPHEAPDFFWAS
tara:strand:+ start:1885 stop:2568 length:684 start_codon:yes stop_codon:yes gene_type:complete